MRDDLEEVLEECSRLRRLGHFADAIALFRVQLDEFLDNRYVLVQYAQCLYEAGQYDQLETLAEEKDPRRMSLDKADALQLNWDMLLLAAGKGPYKSQFDGAPDGLLPAIQRVVANTWPRLDSTQCQILALMPEVGLRLEEAVPPSPSSLSDLYEHLLDKGMVWEFRDVVQGELDSSGPHRVHFLVASFMEQRFHYSPGQNSVDNLRRLWTESAEDEPTLFALLDTFTTAALHRRRVLNQLPRHLDGQGDPTMAECMDAADKCASALLALDNAHLMTRPCLRWLMTKRMVKDSDGLLLFDQLSPRLPDFLTLSTSVFPSDRFPLYHTAGGIIPQWKPRQLPPKDDFGSTAQMVLQAAEQLGDLDLQTGCLKEMMYRGVLSPDRALACLRNAWSSAGNQKMLSWLNLFRALLAHTPSERKELHRDLLLEIETGHKSQVVSRLQILAALSPDKVTQDAFKKMAETAGESTSLRVSYLPLDGDYDPLLNTKKCEADAALMRKAGINTVYVYTVDNKRNHDGCMNAFADQGIYVWLQLGYFPRVTDAQQSSPWTLSLYVAWTKTMDAFARYNNTLAFGIGQETIDEEGVSTKVAPSLKAAARDLHAFRAAKGYRPIPLAYSAANIPSLLLPTAEYLTCATGSNGATIDLLGINIFDDTSCTWSAWDALRTELAPVLSIPVVISELGCHMSIIEQQKQQQDSKEEKNRVEKEVFRDAATVLGPDMRNFFSGVNVFEWTKHAENEYGVVEYRGAEDDDDDDDDDEGAAPTPRRRVFDALSRVYASAAAETAGATPEAEYAASLSAAPQETARPACPARDRANGWLVDPDQPLPTIDGLVIGTVTVEVTPTSSSDSDSTGSDEGGDHNQLSAGAIAGIAVGCAVGVVLAVVAGVLVLRRRRRGAAQQETEMSAVMDASGSEGYFDKQAAPSPAFYPPGKAELPTHNMTIEEMEGSPIPASPHYTAWAQTGPAQLPAGPMQLATELPDSAWLRESGESPPETEKPPSEAPRTMPETQTVLLLHAARKPYELTESYPVPDLRDDHEVLVQTRAIGLNPVDWKAPDFNFAIPELPYIAGRELAGVVVKQRPSSRLKVGDKVLVISTDYRDLRKSAFQHYVVGLDYNTVRLPPSISHEEGSTLGVAFVAAALSLGVCMGLDFSSVLDGPDLYSLIRQLPPDALASDVRDECLNALPSQERARPGDWLAVWGGSSTSANLTIQLARLAGLRTIAVADTAKHGVRLSNHRSTRPDLLVDSHDPARAVAVVRANAARNGGSGGVRFALDTRGKDSAAWLARALARDYAADGKDIITNDTNEAGAAPPSPPGTPDEDGNDEDGILPPAAHLVGLTGLPKEAAPRGVVYHTVPIKVFHEVPAVGRALVEWLERLLARGLVAPPDIVDVQRGLESVNRGLDRMRRGEISGGKLVVRVD
ncbi:hypothetical protein VTH06DRAFT_6235 [Thermothelomyces fergusii]